MRASTSGGLVASLVAAGLAVDACKSPTQVTLAISSTNECAALRGVRIVVASEPREAEDRAKSDFVTAEAPPCAPGTREIGTLVLTPGDDARAAVVVVAGVSQPASSCRSPDFAGCIVARRALSFVDGTSLSVPIEIDFACADVPCDALTTCKRGACVSSALDCEDDGTCRAAEGEDAPGDGGVDGGSRDDRDGGGTADGGASDAASDAGKDGGRVACACPTTLGVGDSCSGDLIQCCHAPAQGGSGAPSASCAPGGDCTSGAVTGKPGIATCCHGSSDCQGGEVCCATFAAGSEPSGAYGTAECRTSCMGPNEVVLCSATSDCPTSSCQPLAQHVGISRCN